MRVHYRRAVALLTGFTAVGLGLVATPAAAHPPSSRAYARIALDWQRFALRTVYTDGATPVPAGTLYLAFTSLAVDDAVSRARGRHRTAAAATAVAAHDVLVAYFPGSTAALDADLAASLATIPDGRAERRGTAIGRAAAAAMIASRVGDGRNAAIVYQRDPAPGVWQPPATGMAVPWLGFVKPLVLRHPVRVDGPDPIGSAAYAADYNEVKRVGSASSTERTAAQTETALFFNANAVVQLREGLLTHLDRHPLSLSRTTRLFAELDAATADTLIQAWRLKYDIGYWRPFQAIAGAASDGNEATSPDPGWTPLAPTPPYPDYLSGHGSIVSSFTAVVGPVLGRSVDLELHSAITGTDRTYSSLRALERDAFMARIWLGYHFRDAMDDAYRLGHRTGKLVQAQYPPTRKRS